jgi:hypothetical protein
MGHRIFRTILNDKVEKFKFVFEQTSKNIFWDEKSNQLIHPGEYGKYREAVCKEFIRLLIPGRLDISEGFIITPENGTSTQCDIIVFDKNNSPLIENTEMQRFFPIETVCAVGEVKSDITKSELKTALNKLAKTKTLREQVKSDTFLFRHNKVAEDFNPIEKPRDNILTFLICNSFKFNYENLDKEIGSFYSREFDPWHKHNFILSIKDGICLYSSVKGDASIGPYSKKSGNFKDKFIGPGESRIHHFYHFGTYLFNATSTITILFPDMADYLNHSVHEE